MLTNVGFISWYRNALSRPLPRQVTALAAAESGDVEAQFGLGLTFSGGHGTERKLDQAARWFRQAALQGHPLAQFNLGTMLTSGDGVPKDLAEGLTWTRKAAEGGVAPAQYSLGSKFHRSSVSRPGDDCAESRIEAYKWFYLAAAQGFQGSAAACERITLQMTREEVADGNQRVASFQARKTDASGASNPLSHLAAE